METTLPSNDQAPVSLKRFVWGNIFALCAIIVTFIGVTVFFSGSITQDTEIGSFVAEVIIVTGPIVVAQSYCLALARLRSAPRQRVFAEVFTFQLATFFAMTIAIAILATLSPSILSSNQSFAFDQGYPEIFSVLPYTLIIIFALLPITIIFSVVVAVCITLATPWREMHVGLIARRQLLLTFGAMFGSAIAQGTIWLVWMPGIVNQTSGASTFVILLVLLLFFLPAIILVTIGAVATWRSLAQSKLFP